jgi:glucose/arabinose dehydrogenase
LKLADDRVSITSAETVIEDQFGRLRDICIAPDGKVYVCTGNGNNDKIIVIDKPL